jgi:ParB-like chromosome segregation protein Spo0J
MSDITIHPAADLFPMMDDASFAELVNDIRDQGQHEPIVFWRGSLIDGRNRLKACQQLGIEPDTCEIDDEVDPLWWVVSANLHRRHLTQSQKAMIAAKLLPFHEQDAKLRMTAGVKVDPTAEMPEGSTKGEAREKAAATVGVSPRLVSDAKAILNADPEVAAKVERGEITVGAAKRATAENSEQPNTAPPSPKAATKVAGDAPRQELTARAFEAYDKLLWAIDALRLRATCYASLAGIHSALEAGVSKSVRNKNGSERVTAASRKAAYAALGGLVRSLDQMGRIEDCRDLLSSIEKEIGK